MTTYLSSEQVRSIDAAAIDDYGLPGIALMENAGRGCADTLCELGIAGRVVICCGKGNNGGDGFVIARHLDLRGHDVTVLLFSDPKKLSGDAATNYRVVQQSVLPVVEYPGDIDPAELTSSFETADWIVDALLGTGTTGSPRPPFDSVIAVANAASARRLAIDLPSGLDCDTGTPSATTFRADHTCTFVAPKLGFRAPSALPFLGAIHVIDIGAPRKLIEQTLRSGSN